jgi:hypothetical protein
MSLKRDNWTNAEVIDLIEGQSLCLGDGTQDEGTLAHNAVVEMIAGYFREHFACPDDDFSALALDTETGEVFHVGAILPGAGQCTGVFHPIHDLPPGMANGGMKP